MATKMARSRARFYSTSSTMSGISSFLKKTFLRSTDKCSANTVPTSSNTKTFRAASNEEISETIRNLGTTMFPNHHSADDLMTINISDLEIKSKCEQQLIRSIPNRALGTITTLGDLISFFQAPPQKPPGRLFPDLRDKPLPSNLSVEFPKARKRKSPLRQPFQNYDDPKHSTFPNKKQLFKKYQVRSNNNL